MPGHLSAGAEDADACAGIFAPDGHATLKNRADTLNGLDSSGIGPLWGGDWTEAALYENGHGSELGFVVDQAAGIWSVTTPLTGDFVIGIKQGVEVAFYLFDARHDVHGGRFTIDPHFRGEDFSNARIYTHPHAEPPPPPPPVPGMTLIQSVGEPVETVPGQYAITISIGLENTGKDQLGSLQILDDLDIFATEGRLIGVTPPRSPDGSVSPLAPNPDYDGIGDTRLLLGTGTLDPGHHAELLVDIEYACVADSAPFLNETHATGIGTASGEAVHADAHAEIPCPTKPPPPPPLPVPAIELTKSIGAVESRATGEWAVPVTLDVSNSGEERLVSVQIEDPLDIFGSAGELLGVEALSGEGLTVDTGYDGLGMPALLLGTDLLEIGASGRVTFELVFRCESPDQPFVNTATATAAGESTALAVSADASAELRCPALAVSADASAELRCPAAPPPPPPPVPAIELTKSFGTVEARSADEWVVPATLDVVNSGDERLVSVQIEDALDFFGAAGELLGVEALSGEGLTVDTGYDGLETPTLLIGTDALAPGASGRVTFRLAFRCDVRDEPFVNTATATASGADSAQGVSATASAELQCPAAPPPPPPPPTAALTLEQQFGDVTATGGGRYALPVTLIVTNTGTDDLEAVRIDDPLDIFGSSGRLVGITGLSGDGLTVNPGFDGISDTGVLAGSDTLVSGSTGTVRFTIEFEAADGSGPFRNVVAATAIGRVSRLPANATADDEFALPPPSPPPPPPPPPPATAAVGGVVYDSLTREVVTGVSVTLGDSLGTPLPTACYTADGPGGPVAADGTYRLGLAFGADPACPDAPARYRLLVAPPTAYVAPPSSRVPPESAALDPASCVPDPDPAAPCAVQPQAGPPTGAGTTYYLAFDLAPGVPDVANNHVPLDRRAESVLLPEKTADRSQASRGEAVGYTVRIDNPGTVPIAGVTLVDDLPDGFRLVDGSAQLIGPGPDGRYDTVDDVRQDLDAIGTDPVTFGPFDVPAASGVLVRYAARIGTGAGTGEQTNCASVVSNGVASEPACAPVYLVSDPLFEQTSLIGRVFTDRNDNGRPDADEGVAGVRLVTVSGLIIETDAFGRYHLAGIDVDRFERGGNFVLKIDESSLPHGSKVIGENPRVLRITEAAAARLDFQVSIPATSRPEARPVTCLEECPTATDQGQSPTTRVLDADACPALEPAPGALPLAPPVAPRVDCTVRRERSETLSADATGFTIRGGLFGCADAVGATLTARDLRTDPVPALTIVADLSEDHPDDECHRYPITVRTAEGSVHEVTRAGDVIRKDYPDNAQWISITPFRDYTRNSDVTALRISNLGRPQSRHVDVTEQLRGRLEVTEDDRIRDPRLDVLALNPALVGPDGHLAAPVRFAAYTNYAVFISAYSLEIYGRRPGTDARLLRTLERDAIQYDGDLHFDGNDDAGNRIDLSRFARLEYVLKAWDCPQRNDRRCSVDKTAARVLAVLPESNAGSVGAEDPASVWGMSNLAEQRIAIDGGRVRIVGTDFTPRRDVLVGGRVVPVDADGRFVYEQYLRSGRRKIEVVTEGVDVRGINGPALTSGAQSITVSGGLYGCGFPVTTLLEGRVRDAPPLDTPAVTAVADTRRFRPGSRADGEDCGDGVARAGRYPLIVKTAEGTQIEVTRAGDVLRRQEAWNNQRIVVTPFRDETRGSEIGALRISNEGVDPSLVEWRETITVDVGEDRWLYVGTSNLTVGRNRLSGNAGALADDPHFDGSTFTDGRIALYAKGRVGDDGRLTARVDSTEDELRDIGRNLRSKDPHRLFRQLDPNRYMPVYGDDSTTTSDVDTQGPLYLRYDWKRNTAGWGNYNTGMTDTDLTEYNRTLYGANLNFQSSRTTALDDTRAGLTAFASEPGSVPAHVTFEATGGSLYYLKHTDIVEGSEKVRIEVRRPGTEQVVERRVLIEGRDYEIDALQGRIILRRPLSQVVRDRADSVVLTRPLDGDDVYLDVDYEYVPQSLTAEDLTWGTRGHVWLGDHVGLGGTRVVDRSNGADYQLDGVDVTLKAYAGTYLSLESARSTARQGGTSELSTDGGLSFRAQNPSASGRSGDGRSIEGRIDLADLNPEHEGDIRVWRTYRDADFSTARYNDGIETTDSGVEAFWRPADDLTVTAGYTDLERELVTSETAAHVQVEGRIDAYTIAAEVRRDAVTRLGDDPLGRSPGRPGEEGEATVVGVRVGYAIDEKTTVYAARQVATDDRGIYADRDLSRVGVNRIVNDRFGLSLEASDGDRGRALISGVDFSARDGLNLNLSGGVGPGAISQFSTSYQVAEGQELYGTYAVDPDRTDGERNLLTLGQRRDLGNKLDIFTESQFGKDDRYANVSHVFGLDFDPVRDWRISASLQAGEHEDGADRFDRKAASVGAYRQGEDLRVASRLEYRRDDGDMVGVRQYVTSSSLTKIVNDNRRWVVNLNASVADDVARGARNAAFAELDIGHAYRPVDSKRLNLIGKLSFLYDLPAPGQDSVRPDERSRLLSLDAIAPLGPRWEVGGKFALRHGERRSVRDGGSWQSFGLRLATVHGRFYSYKSRFEALAEYRWLSDVDGSTTRSGALLGVYRRMAERFKVGVGYNFTDFNDDLRNDGFDNRGWFVDLVGQY